MTPVALTHPIRAPAMSYLPAMPGRGAADCTVGPVCADHGSFLTRRRLLAGAAAVGATGLLSACGSSQTTAVRTAATKPALAPSSTAPSPSVTPSLSASPSPAVNLAADPAEVVSRSHVPILCYHQIREWTAADSTSSRPYICPPKTFVGHLDALKAGGYETISPDQLMAHLTTGADLPEKPVILSYDDSDLDGYTVAAPEMADRGFLGTYFCMTVSIGKSRYMSAAQIKELDAGGHTVAAHTWDHHRVDRYTDADWAVQLDQPKAKLEGILGHQVDYFAYPYGVWKPYDFPHLDTAGYTAAFQLDEKPVDPTTPLLTIQRAIANPYWSATRFMDKVVNGF